MPGELNELQINHFLLTQAIGRIACTDGKKPYIVPVTYVYDGKDIIGQTREGKKLAILRKNPNICFEIDAMTNMENWRSVVIEGTFSELQGEAADKAREYLFNHIWSYLTGSTIHSHEHEASRVNVNDANRIKPIMFRIKVIEKSGKFEKQ